MSPRVVLLAVFCLATIGVAHATPDGRPPFPWLGTGEATETLQVRFPPPPQFQRTSVEPDSIGHWLRQLPVYPGQRPVTLFDGRLKRRQDVHLAVVAIDVGDRDLQQCADAVIRLRAEYLFSRRCDEAIRFDFTSGDTSTWSEWARGVRPRIAGQQVEWQAGRAAEDWSYPSFRRYLENVFSYAGTASLARELDSVPPDQIQIGDVFIEGGFPGHAVLVADLVEGPDGQRQFLLLQSYMPAQQMHVLRNPEDPESPWFAARASGRLVTPEWEFSWRDLYRFSDPDCSP